MTCGERAIRQHIPYRIGKLQKPQAVGNVASALADDFAEIILRIAVFGDQLLVPHRFFERIEVGTLYVFDNCQLQRRAIIHIANDDGNIGKARQLRRTPAPLARNNLVAVDFNRSYDHRLNNSMLSNGGSKILQLILIEVTPRVPLTASDEFDGNGTIGVNSALGLTHGHRLVHFSDQCGKTAPQPTLGKIITHKILLHTFRQTSGGFTQTLSLNHFGRQLQIGLAAGTFQIIENCRLTIGRRFGNTHIAWNERVVDLFAQMRAHIRNNLLCKIISRIEHRKNDALYIELRVHRSTNLTDRIQQLAKALQRKELTLQRHEHGMCGRHGIHRQKIERRRAVDENIGIAFGFLCLHGRTQQENAVGNIRDLHLETEQIHRGGYDVEIGNGGGNSNFRYPMISHQKIIGRKLALLAVDSKPGTRITLRVQIHDQHALANSRQRGSQIDGGCCFANAALLVCNCDNPVFFQSHAAPGQLISASKRGC